MKDTGLPMRQMPVWIIPTIQRVPAVSQKFDLGISHAQYPERFLEYRG